MSQQDIGSFEGKKIRVVGEGGGGGGGGGHERLSVQ